MEDEVYWAIDPAALADMPQPAAEKELNCELNMHDCAFACCLQG